MEKTTRTAATAQVAVEAPPAQGSPHIDVMVDAREEAVAGTCPPTATPEIVDTGDIDIFIPLMSLVCSDAATPSTAHIRLNVSAINAQNARCP